MILDIHLGKEADYTISYKLYDNNVSRLFLQRMSEQKNEVVSRTQFYNFGETKQDIEQKLLAISEKLQQLGLIESTSQEDLNDLHENFPRLHEQHTGSTLELLREFNYCIHHLEDISRGFNSKRFLFTCEGDDGIDLPEEAYEMFTPTKEYGKLYMNYPHVGKHFMELFGDLDTAIPDEQIQLTNKMCNTVYCWFGEDKFTNQHDLDALMLQMFMFYRQIEHKLPYKWKDPKLAIGYLPLGELNQDVDIDAISNNKYVHSWSCK
tara:strand:+ start:1317 stop:2108 length:792 start_codon:yes stop_codon:yes gene_type:complete